MASALRCGVPQVAPIDGNLRIIGGFEVNKNSFPWQVYITNNRIMCGATLVSNLWLVTAAHCVYG
jgi:secreted trypsin-like serine protease